MKELLLYMAKSLVDDPDSVTVTEIEGETTVLELRVAPEDMGKLIGRQGRIAKEIRTIMKSVAQRNGKKVSVGEAKASPTVSVFAKTPPGTPFLLQFRTKGRIMI